MSKPEYAFTELPGYMHCRVEDDTSAMALIIAMDLDNLSFHFDDDPADLVCLHPVHGSITTFHPDLVPIINKRIEECIDVLGLEMMFTVILAATRAADIRNPAPTGMIN